tara:strand:- start:107 stop:385 length:279 start_codon:yes stop_codon:yes gene_type:complete
MKKFPFSQKRIDENTLLREFNRDIEKDDLIWHRDAKDRSIFVIESSGWKLQMDNSLPTNLEEGKTYYISAGEYHRVIKGSGKLKVLIREGNG